jgi:hypothetical protein
MTAITKFEYKLVYIVVSIFSTNIFTSCRTRKWQNEIHCYISRSYNIGILLMDDILYEC